MSTKSDVTSSALYTFRMRSKDLILTLILHQKKLITKMFKYQCVLREVKSFQNSCARVIFLLKILLRVHNKRSRMWIFEGRVQSLHCQKTKTKEEKIYFWKIPWVFNSQNMYRASRIDLILKSDKSYYSNISDRNISGCSPISDRNQNSGL